jgi:U3 small nucleolar RNA-associated protein 10
MQMLLAASPTTANGNNSQSAELSDLVISCFDISAANDLNDEQNMLWDTFVAVLRGTFKSGQLTDSMSCSCTDESTGLLSSSRRIISQSLEHGLFAKLKLERKIAICEMLLDISSGDSETVGAR